MGITQLGFQCSTILVGELRSWHFVNADPDIASWAIQLPAVASVVSVDAGTDLPRLANVNDLPRTVFVDAENYIDGRHVGEVCFGERKANERYSINCYRCRRCSHDLSSF